MMKKQTKLPLDTGMSTGWMSFNQENDAFTRKGAHWGVCRDGLAKVFAKDLRQVKAVRITLYQQKPRGKSVLVSVSQPREDALTIRGVSNVVHIYDTDMDDWLGAQRLLTWWESQVARRESVVLHAVLEVR
jgi:hypothetical protein